MPLALSSSTKGLFSFIPSIILLLQRYGYNYKRTLFLKRNKIYKEGSVCYNAPLYCLIWILHCLVFNLSITRLPFYCLFKSTLQSVFRINISYFDERNNLTDLPLMRCPVYIPAQEASKYIPKAKLGSLGEVADQKKAKGASLRVGRSSPNPDAGK